MPEQVSIIGDGQMALTMADALATRGVQVRLWSPFPKDAQELAATRRSPRLSGFVLNPDVSVIHEDGQALEAASLVVSAIPAQFLRAVWLRLAPHTPADVPVVSVTKGIEIDTLKRPTQVIH